MIELKQVKKTFDTLIFENLNICIRDYGITFIHGKSGCGKTTLFNMLAGIDLDYQGEIFVDKVQYTLKDEETIRYQNIAYLNQMDNLIPEMTVEENLSWIQSMTHSTYNIECYMERFHLKDIKKRYPNQLSGGEKSLMGLLKNILWNRKYLLLDEPNAKLDNKRKEVLKELLLELSQEHSIIIASHDLEFMSIADDIFMIEHRNMTLQKTNDTHKNSEKSKQSHRFSWMSLVTKNIKYYRLRYLFSVVIFSFVLGLGYILFHIGDNLYPQIENIIQENGELVHIQATADDITQDMIDSIQEIDFLEKIDYQFPLLFPSSYKDDIWLKVGAQSYTFKDYPIEYDYNVNDTLKENEIILSESIMKNLNLNMGQQVDIKVYFKIGMSYDEKTDLYYPVLKMIEYPAVIQGIEQKSFDKVYIASTKVEQWIHDILNEDQKKMVTTNMIQLFLKPGTSFSEVQNTMAEYGVEVVDLYGIAKDMLSFNMSTYDILRVFGNLTIVVAIIFILISLLNCYDDENQQANVLRFMGVPKKYILRMQWIQNLIPLGIALWISGLNLYIWIPKLNQYFYQHKLFYTPFMGLTQWMKYTFDSVKILNFRIIDFLWIGGLLGIIIVVIKWVLFKRKTA